VDPVPDPLLLRKSGSAGNRSRDLWICSQELWPLDHQLTSPTSGGRSVGIVRLRTKCHGVLILVLVVETLIRSRWLGYVLLSTTSTVQCVQLERSIPTSVGQTVLQTSKEISLLLQDPKLHYGFQKNPSVETILSQIFQSPFANNICLETILLLFSPMILGLLSSLFPSYFSAKILFVFLISPMYATYIIH
jgi:hypothetical protein